jgi:hypothetical protein
MTTLTLDRSNVSIACEDPGVPTKRQLGGIHSIADYIAFSMGQTLEDPDTDTSYIAPICGEPNDGHQGPDDPGTDGDYGVYEISALLGIGSGFLSFGDREITCGGDGDDEYRGSGRARAYLTRCLAIPSDCTCNPNWHKPNPNCPVH